MGCKISVIIPVYNVQQYLNECIDSVVNQEYSNLEIIIINDGSTDNSENIILEYKKKHKNIKFISQENRGLSESRNRALKHATGEYIMFLDSDDYLEKNTIKTIAQKLEKTNPEILIIAHNRVYELENKKNIHSHRVTDIEEDKIYSGKSIAKYMLINKIEGFSCDKIFNRKHIQENNLEFEKNRYVEDFYPIFKLVNNSNKIIFLNEPFYNYRQRENSITNNKSEKFLYDYIHSVNCVLNYIKENNIEFDEIILETFKLNSLNNILSAFYGLNKTNKNLHTIFNTKEYSKELLTYKKIINNKYLKKKSKLAILLWKLKVYHIFMPTLRKIQRYVIKNIKSTT